MLAEDKLAEDEEYDGSFKGWLKEDMTLCREDQFVILETFDEEELENTHFYNI